MTDTEVRTVLADSFSLTPAQRRELAQASPFGPELEQVQVVGSAPTKWAGRDATAVQFRGLKGRVTYRGEVLVMDYQGVAYIGGWMLEESAARSARAVLSSALRSLRLPTIIPAGHGTE
jgi:hypothetical protein